MRSVSDLAETGLFRPDVAAAKGPLTFCTQTSTPRTFHARVCAGHHGPRPSVLWAPVRGRLQLPGFAPSGQLGALQGVTTV
eukprot:356404-Chlamydomonas_euryale.AAC.5